MGLILGVFEWDFVNFSLDILCESGLSLKCDPVDHDRAEDRAKDKLAYISIARNIYVSRRCQLTLLQK